MSDILDTLPDSVLAARYRWFCRVGWKRPTLNHPSVICGDASPEQIDQSIVRGMLFTSTKPPCQKLIPNDPPGRAA